MPPLLPGEKVVASRHIHWVMPLKAMALPVLLVVLVVLGGDVLLRGNLGGEVRLVLTLLALALAGAWAVVTWIRWTATSFTITDQRGSLDSGGVSPSSRAVPTYR